MESITGINASALRYYEKAGLLPDVGRNKGGRRIYTEEQIGWLRFVLALKNTGMTVEDIKFYMDITVQGEETLLQRRDFLEKHRERVEGQMSETLTQLQRITQKIAFYDATILKKNYLDV